MPPGDHRVSPHKLASVLLQYPTAALFDGLGQLTEAASGASARSQKPFRRFIEWLGRTPPETVARHYVETFDLPGSPGGGGGSSPRGRQSRCALYLTYYRYGDTRKRGVAMLTFTAAYRATGFAQASGELPDYLPLVLDFAALHPRGERLLRSHRADLELLLRGLRDASSPYADVIEGVCAELPALRRPDQELVRRLWESGPPGEEVGVEPFAPPEFLGGLVRSGGSSPGEAQRGAVPPGQHSPEASR
jgi:nitrate reductase delta subunit